MYTKVNRIQRDLIEFQLENQVVAEIRAERIGDAITLTAYSKTGDILGTPQTFGLTDERGGVADLILDEEANNLHLKFNIGEDIICPLDLLYNKLAETIVSKEYVDTAIADITAKLPEVKQEVIETITPTVEEVKTTLNTTVLPKVEKVDEIVPTVEEVKSTTEELKTWVENKEYLQDIDIEGKADISYVDETIAQSVSGLASKEDIPDVSKFISEIPSEYITESELNEKGYLNSSDISHLASRDELFSGSYNDLTDKPEIPSIEGLATKEELNNYATKEELPNLDNYAKIEDIPTDYVKNSELSLYYNKEDLDGLLNNKANITDLFSRSYNDLTDKPEIPSIENLATKEDVQAFENRIGFNNINPDITLCQAIEDNYATKEELEKVQTVAGTNSVLLRDVDSQLFELNTNKADKSEIPSIEGLATEESVRILENNIGYVKVDDRSFAEVIDETFAKKTELPNLEGYATETYVDENIQNVIEIAEGKTNTYVVYLQNNPRFNDPSGFITIDLNTYPLITKNDEKIYAKDLKVGDIILVTDYDIADRWVSYISDDGVVDFDILETRKIDLDDINSEITKLKNNKADKAYVDEAIKNIEHPANPTKVSELENDAKYTNETKVLELIAANTVVADTKIGIDFTTNTTVGHLAAGTQISKDMTLQEILYNILCKPGEPVVPPDAPKVIYLGGTGNPVMEQEDPTADVDLSTLTEYQYTDEAELLGQHEWLIVSGNEEGYEQYPTVIIPNKYNVTAWSTDAAGSYPVSSIESIELANNLTLFYATDYSMDYPQGITYYITIEKK